MHPTARASLLLVVGATAMATANAASWAAGEATGQILPSLSLDGTVEVVHEALARLQRWILAGYAKRPAVMLGLGATFILPVLVLVGFLLYRRRSPHEVVAPLGPNNLHAARIEIEGADTIVLPNNCHLLQIGRQEDNDICIRDETVSRYHAVIERSGDSGFTIVDVSSPDGGGLRINGERMLRAVLSAGDTVELGKARMRVLAAI